MFHLFGWAGARLHQHVLQPSAPAAVVTDGQSTLRSLWAGCGEKAKTLGAHEPRKAHTHTHSVRLVGTSMIELRRSRCSPGRKWTGARLLHVTAMINQSHTVARSFVRRGLKLDDLRAAGRSVHPPLCCAALTTSTLVQFRHRLQVLMQIRNPGSWRIAVA